MNKESLDLLISFVKEKDNIQLNMSPCEKTNLFFIEKLDCKANVFKEIISLATL